LLACDALESTKLGGSISVFKTTFEEFGLPKAIRTDNGVPFCSPNALLGSVWWLRLGIDIERIKPGNPQENGRHERMHLTLKQDTLRDPKKNILIQQEIFDKFKYDFNFERPHEGPNNDTPGSVFKKSRRKFKEKLPELKYPGCDAIKIVRQNGKMSISPKFPVHISDCLSQQPIVIKQVEDHIWRLQFMDIILGHYDQRENSFSKMQEIVVNSQVNDTTSFPSYVTA
jgi:putative transposase